MISFMSANFVARQLNYHMTKGWGEGDSATQAWFGPIETFEERFDAMLAEVSGAGFGAIDLWLAHLHPEWATPRHVEIAQRLLAKHNLTVASLAGNFGSTAQELERSCALAVALGTTVLGGNTKVLEADRPRLVALLRQYRVRLAYENHPAEKTPEDVLAKIGEGDSPDADVIGAAIDTGWFGTNGFDAAKAITRLGNRIFHVHLKDVMAAGAHECVGFGRGVVPIERCVRKLMDYGYTGGLSVEYEPEDRSPWPEVVASAALLKEWLRPNARPFPPGFLWGTATSSYQIEGALDEDGRGRSIWDDFCDREGAIKDRSSGAIACDHYHRYPEDVALMKAMGLKAYRFSIAWPRILKDGTGEINPKGVDFYSRLIDALLEAGITPYGTLYHWDLPTTLQAKGGWANRDIAGWFADYAAICARAFGDRMRDWITLNEPWCTAFLGYDYGAHAPGIRDTKQAYQSMHNTLLAHGQGLQALRACLPHAQAPARCGITLNFQPGMPYRDYVSEDREAAAMANRYNGLYQCFAAPILTGAYPVEVMHMAGDAMPQVLPGDMALISQRNDFIGVNYYTPTKFVMQADRPHPKRNPNTEYTLMRDWEVEPDGLTYVLTELHRDSKGLVPLYITENGCSYPDVLSEDGRVHDDKRIAYLRGHFAAVQRAIAAGVDLRGYFVWSFMDNFEWAEGYTQFFGLVHVDYATQKRTPKDSAQYVRNVIAANAV